MGKFRTTINRFFVLSFLLNANQVKTSNLEESDCGVGTYLSKYFNRDGSCIDCPEHWAYCQNEHAGDEQRCEKACGKPTLSPSTPSTAQFFESTSSPTVQQSNPTFEKFLTPSNPDSDVKKKTVKGDDDNKMLWVKIIVPVFSLILTLAVGIVVFVRYRKIKTESNSGNVQEDGPTVIAQAPSSISVTSEKYPFQETDSAGKYSSSVSLNVTEF